MSMQWFWRVVPHIHQWRRLHKVEAHGSDDAALIRVCRMCGVSKMVKPRKAKGTK